MRKPLQDSLTFWELRSVTFFMRVKVDDQYNDDQYNYYILL